MLDLMNWRGTTIVSRACFLAFATLSFFNLHIVAAEKPKGAAETPVFEYSSGAKDPQKSVRYVVTKDGLSQINIGNEQVAKGKWEARDFSNIMDLKSNYDWRKEIKEKAWDFKEKSLEVVNARHVRVTHRSAEVEVVYNYMFSNEDVEIQCLLKNLTSTKIYEAVRFGDITFNFTKKPEGLFCPMSATYPGQIIPTCRAPNFHPSFGNNFGGSEISDGNFGVGATPLRTGWTPAVLAWQASYKDGKESDPRSLHFIRAVTIVPGSSVCFDLLLRVSRNCDWKYLLDPYKKYFNETFGQVRYKNSNKPIGYLQGTSDKWIKEGNPFGYYEKYRFDKDEGVKSFIDDTIPLLKRANAQGFIMWSFTPYNMRGCNFRPDTDVLPPQVWKQIPPATEAFKKAGLGFGICMRPQIVTTYDWEHDTVLSIHPEELSQLALATRPFNRLMKDGMNTFYLDTFGTTPNDTKTMKFLREQWGEAQVFTATEFWNDVSLLYSPGYAQYNWDDKAKAYKEVWRREHLWEVCQWMSPGVQLASPQNVWDSKFVRPEGTPDPFRYLYQNHVIPIFYTGTRTTGEMVEQLSALTKEYLNDKGEFIK